MLVTNMLSKKNVINDLNLTEKMQKRSYYGD